MLLNEPLIFFVLKLRGSIGFDHPLRTSVGGKHMALQTTSETCEGGPNPSPATMNNTKKWSKGKYDEFTGRQMWRHTLIISIPGGWFGTFFILSIYWECHHPN